MARPYRDPVEIHTAPVPAQSPFIPADAKIVVGVVAPASPDPIPIVLLPGFEYRMGEWRHPNTAKSIGDLSGGRSPNEGKQTSSPPNAKLCPRWSWGGQATSRGRGPVPPWHRRGSGTP